MARDAVASACTTDTNDHQINLTSPDTLEGTWDPTRVEQVITNLLDNALRYSPPGTSVNLTVSQSGGTARVEVKDSGPGIPEYQRPYLFNRYYGPLPDPPTFDQDYSPRKKRGLGLGLYVSAEIVSAHGGEIGVRPGPEGGSIFWFTLPIADPLAD
jgi:signal transduction histidine kinase